MFTKKLWQYIIRLCQLTIGEDTPETSVNKIC